MSHFNNDIEKELASLAVELESAPVKSYKDQRNKAHGATQGLSLYMPLCENALIIPIVIGAFSQRIFTR